MVFSCQEGFLGACASIVTKTAYKTGGRMGIPFRSGVFKHTHFRTVSAFLVVLAYLPYSTATEKRTFPG